LGYINYPDVRQDAFQATRRKKQSIKKGAIMLKATFIDKKNAIGA
jgi:hypothetical protein